MKLNNTIENTNSASTMKISTIGTKEREIRILIGVLSGIIEQTLTKREMDTLVEFILLPVKDVQRFSLLNKKKVVEALNSKYNYKVTNKSLSPILIRLTELRFLKRQSDNEIYILPTLNKYLQQIHIFNKLDINISLLINENNL
jgi:hypothetical protein